MDDVVILRFQTTYEELKPWTVLEPADAYSCFQTTYEELKQSFDVVAYLLHRFQTTYEELKRSVATSGRCISGFQTTYEELKLYRSRERNIGTRCRFQTTYEELKRDLLRGDFRFHRGFQTTYEELKLSSHLSPPPLWEARASRLPMRN